MTTMANVLVVILMMVMATLSARAGGMMVMMMLTIIATMRSLMVPFSRRYERVYRSSFTTSPKDFASTRCSILTAGAHFNPVLYKFLGNAACRTIEMRLALSVIFFIRALNSDSPSVSNPALHIFLSSLFNLVVSAF